MKSSSYRSYSPRFLAPLLLGMGIILTPGHSNGQAINACNLIPNPSFEQQNVAQLSGNPDNVRSDFSVYDEVTGWKSTSNGRPDYFATNSPTGTATNPASAGLTPMGSNFQPYNYNQALHNGAVGIIAATNGTTTTRYSQEFITPTSPLRLSEGMYYASFRAYRSSSNTSTTSMKLGMNLTTADPYTSGNGGYVRSSTSIESPIPLQLSDWTRVAGQISIPAPSNTDWYVNIGNFDNTPSSLARTLYYIDEIELYKIPTAGPNISCFNSSAIIGEGCHIPGATYAWRVNGQPNPIATTIQTSVATAGTYALTVTLPNGSTHVTSTSVTAAPAEFYLELINQPVPLNICSLDAEFQVVPYNPSLTYTITLPPYMRKLSTGVRSNGTFSIQPNSQDGVITVSATGPCGFSWAADYTILLSQDCYGSGRIASNNPNGLSYPNPASESLVIPIGTTKATLLNSQGKPVAQPDATGKVNVQSLPAGLYNLRMQQNGKTVNQRIEVKH